MSNGNLNQGLVGKETFKREAWLSTVLGFPHGPKLCLL